MELQKLVLIAQINSVLSIAFIITGYLAGKAVYEEDHEYAASIQKIQLPIILINFVLSVIIITGALG